MPTIIREPTHSELIDATFFPERVLLPARIPGKSYGSVSVWTFPRENLWRIQQSWIAYLQDDLGSEYRLWRNESWNKFTVELGEQDDDYKHAGVIRFLEVPENMMELRVSYRVEPYSSEGETLRRVAESFVERMQTYRLEDASQGDEILASENAERPLEKPADRLARLMPRTVAKVKDYQNKYRRYLEARDALGEIYEAMLEERPPKLSEIRDHMVHEMKISDLSVKTLRKIVRLGESGCLD